MNDKQPTKTIFRKFKDGDVIAIFPEEPGTMQLSTCASYMHMGQHSACSPNLLIGETKLATPEEYASLKEELKRIGYNVQVIKKLHQSHLIIRGKYLQRG
jgi:hypothetical protein